MELLTGIPRYTGRYFNFSWRFPMALSRQTKARARKAVAVVATAARSKAKVIKKKAAGVARKAGKTVKARAIAGAKAGSRSIAAELGALASEMIARARRGVASIA